MFSHVSAFNRLRFPSLTFLSLTISHQCINQCPNLIRAAILSMTNLRYLILHNCQVSLDGYMNASLFPKLETFCLEHATVTSRLLLCMADRHSSLLPAFPPRLKVIAFRSCGGKDFYRRHLPQFVRDLQVTFESEECSLSIYLW